MQWLLKNLTMGFVILLPSLLMYLLVGQLFAMLVALTAPLQDLLPDKDAIFALSKPVRSVLWLVVLLSLVGAAARTPAGRTAGDGLEHTALNRLPLSPMRRNLAHELTGAEDLQRFRPTLVTTWPNMRTIAFIVEEHANGDATIFMPIAPTPTIGYVSVVGREHVALLDVPPQQALGAVLSWGDGVEAALKPIPGGHSTAGRAGRHCQCNDNTGEARPASGASA